MRNYSKNYSRYRPNQAHYNRGRQYFQRTNNSRKGEPVNVIHWRDSNDYRKEYFEKNKGIAGMLYICSQCIMPMVNKSKIQVDHIIPPSRFARHKTTKNTVKNTSFISRALNNTFNCVAICERCNKRKGAKIGFVTAKAIVAKVIELSIKAVQVAAIATLYLALLLAPLPFRIAGWLMRRKRGKRRSYGRYCY